MNILQNEKDEYLTFSVEGSIKNIPSVSFDILRVGYYMQGQFDAHKKSESTSPKIITYLYKNESPETTMNIISYADMTKQNVGEIKNISYSHLEKIMARGPFIVMRSHNRKLELVAANAYFNDRIQRLELFLIGQELKKNNNKLSFLIEYY